MWKSRFFIIFGLLMEGSVSGLLQIITDPAGPKTTVFRIRIRIDFALLDPDTKNLIISKTNNFLHLFELHLF